MKEVVYSDCGRLYIELVCGKCGRSPDLEREMKVFEEKKKEHRNWKCYVGVKKVRDIE